MDALSIILEALAPLAGRDILDIGCGAGTLAKTLAGRGAIVTGIDPNGGAVAAATRAVPGATFLEAFAEHLPLADGVATGAVFLNSLHHASDPDAALREARRVVRPGSPVVVVEPLARGTYFEVLRLFDDETPVRTEAQEALRRAVDNGAFECRRDETYERISRFKDLEDFFGQATAVDPERSIAIDEHRSAIAAVFGRVAEREGAQVLLRQPLRVQVLVRPKGPE